MKNLACLSVIIPTLNEASTLPRLLSQLQSQRDIELDIIVADGGSIDATRSIAELCKVRFTTTAAGRALQMNAGAGLARFDSLLFLHADSALPDKAFLCTALAHFDNEQQRMNSRSIAGHFALHFEDRAESNQLAYRFLEEKSATNRPYTINGDQALLVKKNYFEHLGGFDESFPFMEDQAIAAKIFATGKWLLLPGRLASSARRFEAEGFHRRYVLMSLMMGLYWTGAREFFAHAKNVYQQQSQTGALRLSPYFSAVWKMLVQDFGWKRSLRQWFLVGRYVRQNGWQLFFWLDLVFWRKPEKRRYHLTRIHDRFVKPLCANVVCDTVAMIFTFVWYMVVLASFYFIADYRSQPRLSQNIG